MESNNFCNSQSGFLGNICIKEENMLSDSNVAQDSPNFQVRSIKSELNPSLKQLLMESSTSKSRNGDKKESATSKTVPSFNLFENSFESEIMAQFQAANQTCKCDECPKTYPDKYKLNMHKRSCHSPRFKCKQCNQLFYKKRELVIHLSDHVENSSSVLQQQLTSIANNDPENCNDTEKLYLNQNSSEKNFECENCEEKFSTSELLMEHEEIVHLKVMRVCPICAKKFRKEHDLKRHSSTHVKDGPFQCKSCDGKFEHPFFLIMHQRSHSDAGIGINQMILECPVCLNKFYNAKIFKDHLLKHLESKSGVKNDKEYEMMLLVNDAKAAADLGEKTPEVKFEGLECLNCKLIFKSKDTLRKHLVLHTEDYKCELCGKILNGKWSYQQHMHFHNGKKNFVCHICDKKFYLVQSLKKHTRTHEDQTKLAPLLKPKFECDQCSKIFRQETRLNDHMEVVHKIITPLKYECDVCKSKFKTRKLLLRHLRIHLPKEKPHQCKQCGKRFIEPHLLKFHEQVHTGEKPFQCDLCSRKFFRKDSMRRHIKRHLIRPTLKCNDCSFAFYDKCNLKNHVRIHTGEKPYECEICKKTFARSLNLKCHLQVHMDDRPYQCDICKKKFKRSCNLTDHLKVHSGNRPYKCDFCNATFKFKWRLNNHRRLHTRENLLECNKCNKSYVTHTELQVHLRSHTGERPFKCNECGKGFFTRTHLRSHVSIHSGEKPFTCKICSKNFREKRALSKHLKVHRQGKGHKCNACQKTFTLKTHLNNHNCREENLKPEESEELVVSYQCANCDKNFSDITSFKQHQVIHIIKKEEPED